MTFQGIFCVVLIVLSASPNLLAQNAEGGSRQYTDDTERLSPKMLAVDRDWKYFKSVHCDDIAKVVFHSRSEEILLAKRKSQCLNKYNAFFPNPVDR